jgi:hypothetical protein
MTKTVLVSNNQEVVERVASKINFNLAYPCSSFEDIGEFKESLSFILESKTLIDTHNSQRVKKEFDGFVVLQKGEICPIYDYTYFCLNPLVVRHNNPTEVLLLSWSTAGTILGQHGVDGMKSAFEKYNKSELEFNARVFQETPDQMRNQVVFMQFKGEQFFFNLETGDAIDVVNVANMQAETNQMHKLVDVMEETFNRLYPEASTVAKVSKFAMLTTSERMIMYKDIRGLKEINDMHDFESWSFMKELEESLKEN